MKSRRKLILFALLAGIVAVIGLLHKLTPGHMILYHDTYRRLSYFPITIGAIIFGLPGGIILAILSCLAFIPHLYAFWAAGPEAYYSEMSEILFYLAAGVVIGLISSRENRLRERYKTLSEKLSASYQRLHDQTSRLVEAERQLGESRKLSMLGHVSASLAHEIKNPLASIKGAAEILADEVPEDHPKYEFIEIMRSEISRLNHSVEEVLNYCRGQQQPETGKKAEVGKIVQKVVALLETAFRGKNIHVKIKTESDADLFTAEEDAVTQVLMNILINAVDAVENEGRIEIEVGPDKENCRICVSDDGPGIDPDQVEDVFESFVTFKEGGTGLGLSISKRIMESLGGHIRISRSELGGAMFSITLPEKTNTIMEGFRYGRSYPAH